MATPRQLVETVAEVLGVSVATVIVHDRNLSTAPVPLRTVAGRGRAAAKITAVDAANLLIAVAASESVKNSVWTVLTYGGLRGSKFRTTPSGIPSIDRLPASHTLGEGLAAFIDAVAAEELNPKTFSSTVRFYGPRPRADIQYHTPETPRSMGEESIGYELKPKAKWPSESGDMFRTTEFSEITILRVGAIIRETE
jgi:hypothetical protein